MPRPFRNRTGAVECEVDTSRLNQILRNLPGNRRDAIRTIAFSIQRKAQMKAPVDTGALRNSIYVRMENEGMMPTVDGDAARVELPEPDNGATAHVGPSMEYGLYVEFGTSRMAARPYLGPAVNEAESELARTFRPVVTDE